MKPKITLTILLYYLLAIQLPFCFIVAQNSSSEITAFREGIPLTNITRLLPVSRDDNVIKVSAAGDIMMGRKVAETIKENNDDFTLPFQNIKDYLEGVDIKIANLEAQITDSHLVSKPIIPCNETTSGCCDLHCHFKTDKRVVEGLDYSGLNLLLLENNHIEDYYHGRQDTMDTLDAANITWIDADHPLEILNYKGCNLSFFNYDAVLRDHTEDVIQNLIEKELKNAEQNSFKTVLIHAGKEYAFNETLKQRELAHAAINSGADIVLFSHAHVVLGHEVYKGKYIFWGLGNFVFDQFFNDRVKQFLMVKFDIVNCTAVDNVELVTGVIDEESQPTYENSVFL